MNLRDQEGYFMTDHRYAAPVPEHLLRAAGLPVQAGRGLFEAPTFTCSHCQAVKVKNPSRNEDYHYCKGCSHLICDTCKELMGATGQCRTFDQLVNETLNAAVRQSSGG